MGKLSSFYYGKAKREMDGVFTKRIPQMISKAAYAGETMPLTPSIPAGTV